ncbi:MAG: aspartate carbamoyltransferase [Candidatus Berkelbacteria bacterium]|nr:aspartate carbamoyltransferase [Candidatus Berkelbacteria bacterium]
MDSKLTGRDLLTTEDLSLDELREIMLAAHKAKEGQRPLFLPHMNGRVALCFFERSTRTHQSFLTAAQECNCNVIGFSSTEGTSVGKGESLADTIATLAAYDTDLLVIRHPDVGSAKIAADICKFPVINAGDGNNQHPTQALLDILCMLEYFGGFSVMPRGSNRSYELNFEVLQGKTVAICGDLKNGRTLHSGIPLYRLLGMNLILCAPEELQIPTPDAIETCTTNELEYALEAADILYMTRFQWERPGMEELQHLKGRYILRRQTVERINPTVAIMHPLPRIAGEHCEIYPDVDDLKNALYFRLQTPCGMWTRIALLRLLMR